MDPHRRVSLVTAVLAGLAAVATSFAVAGSTPRFVVARTSGVLVAATPGVVTATAIEQFGHAAQTAAFVGAGVLTVGLFAAVTALGLVAGRGLTIRFAGTLATVLFSWNLATLLTGDLRLALAPAAGAGLVVLAREAGDGESGRTDEDQHGSGRRTLLRTGITAAGITGAGVVLGRRTARTTTTVEYDPPPEVTRLLADARDRSFDLPDVPGLVSAVESFYEVDINAINPVVDPGEWTLTVDGSVTTPQTLTHPDLRERPAEHRFLTVRCVGDSLNGRKMDTALWTGVPLAPLLEAVGADGQDVRLHAADGYFQAFPLDALRNGFLAYAMNGVALPRAHGAPLRLLVPGHWGEIQVKWLTRIEVVPGDATGYWERRGWMGTGPVHAVAKLHAVERQQDGRVRVGGHAYAGTRGVSQVEVSTDGGETWADARLSDRLPATAGADGSERPAVAWRQWQYTYEPPAEPHDVVVRATDDDGVVQRRERSDPFPSGPTGWVTRTIRP